MAFATPQKKHLSVNFFTSFSTMKNILLSALLGTAIISTASAQSQRMVFVEEFTQASCGPCAAQNPAFNARLANNTSKVISLKYQTSWPGTDPMNAQTQTWVGPRVSYYGIQGVPNICTDGNAQQKVAPSQLTQTVIDNRYATPSPFTMALSHSFSPTYDSIYVALTVTASSAVSAGSLVLQTAVAERDVIFSTPPGTNGEKEFYHVMRTMYPDASGTALSNTWAVGQSQTFNFAIPTPSYIYSIAEVEIVAFIQDNTTKEVHQAALSQPLPVNLDAALAGINSIQTVQCGVTTFDAVVTIENKGTDPLTSCDINIELNNKLISTTSWSGNLATGATDVKTIAGIPVAAGGQKLRIYCSNPNGSLDLSANNNSKLTTFVVAAQPTGTAVTEKFGAVVFPPANWGVLNVQMDAQTWMRSSAGLNGGGSARIPFFNIQDGDVDELFMPAMDFSSSTSGANLVFDIAGAGYPYTNGDSEDTLRIMISTDCGATWDIVWEKFGADLYTAAAIQTGYTPKSTEWRNEVVDLTAYQGNTNVLVKFSAHSNYGNNVFIDNVNMAFNTAISADALLANGVSLFPNPAKDAATVNFTLNDAANVTATLYNALGGTVRTISLGKVSGEQQLNLDLGNLAAGMYMLQLNINGAITAKALTVTK